MIKQYFNQNHGIQRTENPFEKVATVYDKMGISNRVDKNTPLSFSNLAPHESEDILTSMKKEADEFEQIELDKKASFSNPFEAFGNAKNYISSKLGLNGDISHELASSVLGRAQDLHSTYGGDLGQMVTGIVDNMDKQQIHSRLGVIPMRPMSPKETEDAVEQGLMQGFQLSAYQVDQYTKIVMQQARNLSTIYRNSDIGQIALAVVHVLVQHQDITLVNNISSSSQLKEEIRAQLKM